MMYLSGLGSVCNNIFTVIADGRNVTFIFQKVGQVALSAIKLANYNMGTNYLPKFCATLTAVNMHDLHLILREGRGWFFPINAYSINAPVVLAALKIKLREQLPQQYTDQQVNAFAQLMLEKQLESMDPNADAYLGKNDRCNNAYRSEAEFLKALQKRLRERPSQVQEIHPPIERLADGTQLEIPYAVRQNIRLRGMPVALNQASNLSKAIHTNWMVVNVLCVASYLQTWKLLDTAKYAHMIGQVRALSFVKQTTLEAWLRGTVTLGFVGTFVREAINWKISTNDVESNKARMAAAASLAEIVYQGAGFTNCVKLTSLSPAFICSAAIVAKTLGIVLIKHASDNKPTFLAPAA